MAVDRSISSHEQVSMTPVRSLAWLLFGAVLGSIAVFIFDPNSGRRRRSFLRDKGVHLQKVGVRLGRKRVRHIRNRVKGMMYKAQVGNEASRTSMRQDLVI